MRTIRLGIIGIGGRGFGMYSLFRRHGGYEVCALCDVEPKRIDVFRALAREDGLDADEAFYSDLEQFLAHPGLEAIYVATPDYQHVEPSCRALERGLHVLCEKPLAVNEPDCRIIGEAAERSGALFYLGFNLRHLPTYERAWEIVAAGELGRIHMVNGKEYYYSGATYFQRWNRFRQYGGGMFVTKLTHDFDILQYVVGQKIRRVVAFGNLSVFRPDEPDPEALHAPYRQLPGWEKRKRLMAVGEPVDQGDVDVNLYTSEKDTIDNASVLLDFENDLRGVFSFSVFQARACSGRELEIIGDEAHLRMASGRITIEDRHGRRRRVEEFDASGGHGGCDEILVNDFHRCVAEKEKPRATWQDGARSVRVGLAAQRSLETGGVVEVPED